MAKYSFPKEKIKVLLLENIDQTAKKAFEQENYPVEILSGSITEDELIEAIKDVYILGIRSKTQLTAKVLEQAKHLLAVGAFCIGTNQIDLRACTKKGVAVFNDPFSNSRSVAELVIGLIVMLKRRIFEKSILTHQGIWQKSAIGSNEVRGKKLGIVGYGRIGTQLSILAEAMGMQVFYYDLKETLPISNAKKCNSLKELLGQVDVVTLHVDGRPENNNFFGQKEFEQMKPGAIFINLSRGFVVDIKALAFCLKEDLLSGAAIDVFPKEPKSQGEKFSSELLGFRNVILTPHIGGSTIEAQSQIGTFVSGKLINFINTGDTTGSVSLPSLSIEKKEDLHRFIHIHRNVPGVMGQITNVLSEFKMNILNQGLRTNEDVGYVITDVNRKYNQKVVKRLKEIDETIKFRLIF